MLHSAAVISHEYLDKQNHDLIKNSMRKNSVQRLQEMRPMESEEKTPHFAAENWFLIRIEPFWGSKKQTS